MMERFRSSVMSAGRLEGTNTRSMDSGRGEMDIRTALASIKYMEAEIGTIDNRIETLKDECDHKIRHMSTKSDALYQSLLGGAIQYGDRVDSSPDDKMCSRLSEKADIDSGILDIEFEYASAIHSLEAERGILERKLQMHKDLCRMRFRQLDDIKPYIMEWYYLDHIELQEISRRLQYSKRQIQRIKQESEHELGLAAGDS